MGTWAHIHRQYDTCTPVHTSHPYTRVTQTHESHVITLTLILSSTPIPRSHDPMIPRTTHDHDDHIKLKFKTFITILTYFFCQINIVILMTPYSPLQAFITHIPQLTWNAKKALNNALNTKSRIQFYYGLYSIFKFLWAQGLIYTGYTVRVHDHTHTHTRSHTHTSHTSHSHHHFHPLTQNHTITNIINILTYFFCQINIVILVTFI